MNDLPSEEPEEPGTDLPDPDLEEAFEVVLSSPNTASKEWVYRQYDHEVGVRTSVGPGDDAALLAIRETGGLGDGAVSEDAEGTGLAISAGGAPNWTAADPEAGARAIAVENATNLATKGARPLAAVDCLNGGNPEKPDVYGGFSAAVSGLAAACSELAVPVVGGNVSLYNDSATGPIPPTPTLAMVGTKRGYEAPPLGASPEGDLLLVGSRPDRLGGSEYLARFGGSDRFLALPDDPAGVVDALAAVADLPGTVATHDVSHGGLAVSLAEMVTEEAGLEVSLPGEPATALFAEGAGRALIQTSDPDAVREAFEGVAPVTRIGEGTDEGTLRIDVGETDLSREAAEIREHRSVIGDELD